MPLARPPPIACRLHLSVTGVFAPREIGYVRDRSPRVLHVAVAGTSGGLDNGTLVPVPFLPEVPDADSILRRSSSRKQSFHRFAGGLTAQLERAVMNG